VQVFLQNRRQRDTKNRNAALEAQTAKKEAKDSIAEMSATPVTFSAPAQATHSPREDSSRAESAAHLSSQSTLSLISEALQGKLSSVNTPPPSSSSSSEPRSRDSKRSRAEFQIPSRRISLNRVAEMMENTRRSPSSPTTHTDSKENVPAEPLSSSPAPTEPLVLAETNTTPIKPSYSSQASLSPSSAALWTRMISSPPTPLSPMNRRADLQPRPALKSLNKMQSLELACAKARIRDRRSEDRVDQTLILRSSKPSTTASSAAATPTAIASKRLREDVEKDVPRKRASISELQDLMGGPEHWNHQPHSHTAPKHSMLRQVVAQRASSVTDSSCDTSTGDEIVTPDMSSLPPSSPQSVTCQVPFPSDTTSAAKDFMKTTSLRTGSLDVMEDPLHGLAPLEANAAMVLASLFGGL
jgi:hypothetical protein